MGLLRIQGVNLCVSLLVKAILHNQLSCTNGAHAVACVLQNPLV